MNMLALEDNLTKISQQLENSDSRIAEKRRTYGVDEAVGEVSEGQESERALPKKKKKKSTSKTRKLKKFLKVSPRLQNQPVKIVKRAAPKHSKTGFYD